MRIQDPDDHFTEYYIRELDRDFHGHHFSRFPPQEFFEIAKFTGKAQPEVVYHVHFTCTGRMVCDCPSQARTPTRWCKHAHMINDFRNAGKPATFPQFEKFLPI